MTGLPRELEPKVIASALEHIFGQIDAKGAIEKIAQTLGTLTTKQEGLYKEVVGFTNKHQEETTKTLDKSGDVKNKIMETGEQLADDIVKLKRSAPESGMSSKLTPSTPSASSQR